MLLNMHIKNIVLIDELDINFEKGLNILTGETGAGKSIIVGSLGIGLGGKFQRDILRNPEEDGLVELAFWVDSDHIRNRLKALDIEPTEENEILISRRLNGSRVINRINDVTVTAAKIKAVAEVMMNLHAQHEQQTLLKPAKHLEILDSFSEKLIPLKQQVAESYRAYAEVKEKLEAMNMDSKERAKRLDYIQYEIKEIEAAGLSIGEEEELEALYKRIKNARDIISLSGEVYEITGYERGSSAGNEISRALQTLRKLSSYDEGAEGIISMLVDIDALMNDFNREISEYMADLEFDEAAYQETEERLDIIHNLEAKYGKTIEEVLHTYDSLVEEYKELQKYDETLEALKQQEKISYQALEEQSGKLTAERKKQAELLCGRITDALKELNFSQVIFRMEFEETREYSANGHDAACFMISTNVGEKERPLYEVASGGELSRVMLAIKSCFASAEDTPTLVFDEIDVGISGITAQRVARMMAKLSSTHQVISITHLPQIAAMADVNYLIRKSVIENKTVTDICKLNREGAELELARLLGGENITEQVLSSAKEMKSLAEKEKLCCRN